MMGYGFFPGGDPRRFFPDPEASTDAERAKHKADCEAWDRGDMPNVNDKAPHWTDKDGVVAHVTPAGYGLGVYDEDDDEDELPPELQPHEPRSDCECDACYEAGVLARFRDSQKRNARA